MKKRMIRKKEGDSHFHELFSVLSHAWGLFVPRTLRSLSNHSSARSTVSEKTTETDWSISTDSWPNVNNRIAVCSWGRPSFVGVKRGEAAGDVAVERMSLRVAYRIKTTCVSVKGGSCRNVNDSLHNGPEDQEWIHAQPFLPDVEGCCLHIDLSRQPPCVACQRCLFW